jgi:hypothetical protein
VSVEVDAAQRTAARVFGVGDNRGQAEILAAADAHHDQASFVQLSRCRLDPSVRLQQRFLVATFRRFHVASVENQSSQALASQGIEARAKARERRAKSRWPCLGANAPEIQAHAVVIG